MTLERGGAVTPYSPDELAREGEAHSFHWVARSGGNQCHECRLFVTIAILGSMLAEAEQEVLSLRAQMAALKHECNVRHVSNRDAIDL